MFVWKKDEGIEFVHGAAPRTLSNFTKSIEKVLTI